MTYNLLQALENILYHGEFAAWLNDQEMPWAAAKELEEFERVVDELKEDNKDDQVDIRCLEKVV